MADEGQKRKASEIAQDADDSVEEAEVVVGPSRTAHCRPVAVHRDPTIALAWAFEIAWVIGGTRELTSSGASDDVGGGACARGAVDAKRVFGAPCERLVERMGFADGEFLDVGARRCIGAGNGCVGGSAIVCGAAGESVCGVQSAIGVTTVWTGDCGGAASSRGLSGCAAPQQVLGSMSRTATPGAPGEEEKSMAAEEEEPPRDPEDRLPSLHRS
ncbi:hypothetical protein DYB26_009149 [Aphanomyces astaci]|uniref:Uncharacterized protein n=1 Tax=Aphanomyces astaci TaxID=112090 RepID=A0A3R7ALE6_APHAT|nr:hypothetical protein DYB26_009149 [Aphanomyces astaci]